MSEEKTEVSAMSDEQAADLAALAAAAQEAPGPAAQAEAEAQAESNAGLGEEIAGLLRAFAIIAKPILPSLEEIYTEQTAAAVGEAVARVCVKHGWLAGGVMGGWGEEIAAAVVVLPVAVATYQGIGKDIDAKRQGAKRRDADLQQHLNITRNLDGNTIPKEAPGSNTVTAGAPIVGAAAA